MASSYGYYGDDGGALRHGYGSQSYSQYGARQAAEARLHASNAIPYLRPEANFYTGPSASTSALRPDQADDRSPRGRPRSLPPLERRPSRRYQRRSPSPSIRAPRDPIRRAQGVLKETFSDSTSGLGVGVLGALVGGIVAREASEASSGSKNHSRRRSHHDAERSRLISTVLGAVVGGLGANAIEKRVQVAREKTANEEEVWERKWQRDSKGRRLEYRHSDELDDDREGLRGRRR